MAYLSFKKSDSKLKEFKVQEVFACLFVEVNNVEVQKLGLASVVFFTLPSLQNSEFSLQVARA